MDKQHLVIGSAGHIDHGKSSIVKALTHIDPTRLKEEREKNITIDLGFSYLHLKNQTVGIIDLPGHEKFISNMIVGSSNIDMILFVIAADDGIMPQTVEHFDILKLLQIKHAVIVLNKVDLVTPELLQQREEEIREFFSNSIFEKSPLVKTSIYDEKSIDNLRDVLTNYIENNQFEHKHFDIFRMAIDRSFTLKGQGTVVTGTSQGKELFVNETLQIYPSNKLVKVRNIQNHNKDVKSIVSGQRTALQLANITKEEIKRGDLIATPNSLQPTKYLDVIIDVLKSSKPIKNNQLLRIYHQTKEFIGRIKLPTPTVRPGTSSFATIVLQVDMYALKDDLAIVRFFSPIKTIAGLRIINALDQKPKITQDYYNKYLNNNLTQQIKNYVESNKYANDHQINMITPNKREIDEALALLIAQKTLREFSYNNKPHYILNEYLDSIKEKITLRLYEYHKNNPLFLGMPTLELYKTLNDDISFKVFKALLVLIPTIKIENDISALRTFKINYTNEQKQRKNSIMTMIKNNGYALMTFSELYEKFNQADDKLIVQAMIKQKEIIIINNDYLILDRMYSSLLKLINELVGEDGRLYLADFKDKLDISRKYCLILLDYLDNEGITKRIDDYRIIVK